MKKLIALVSIVFFTLGAFSQDKMNKKMENKTDKMNKKMENKTDKMNKKQDSTAKKPAAKARKVSE